MSANVTQSNHTEHALLVLLGQYAQHLGLIQALMDVPLHQKTCTHRPQAKILEFLVAVLAGLPHLEDIGRDGRPLDQDQSVALAWQKPSQHEATWKALNVARHARQARGGSAHERQDQ